jgi:hypothetical protein
LERILAYLRSGYTFADWMGYSFCRFGCGVDGRPMGSSDRTDGEWVWPAGLAHYVASHGVFLPEEFVNTMRWNEWRVPALDRPPRFGREPGDAPFDLAFWVEWARRHQRRPWYVLW